MSNQHTAIIDSGTTSSCRWPDDPFITTGWISTKTLQTPLRKTWATTEQKEIQHNLWQPAKIIDIVRTLKASHSLQSTSKLADANYITKFTTTEVQIYDGETTKINLSQPPVLKGWQNEVSGLWHVPLTAKHTKQQPTNSQEQAHNVFELKQPNYSALPYGSRVPHKTNMVVSNL